MSSKLGFFSCCCFLEKWYYLSDPLNLLVYWPFCAVGELIYLSTLGKYRGYSYSSLFKAHTASTASVSKS